MTMALYPSTYSATGAVSTSSLHIHHLELVPDGGTLDLRILQGTDTDGTEKYRIVATENPEYRNFQGVTFPGPVYFYFYDGDGSVSIVTEENI